MVEWLLAHLGSMAAESWHRAVVPKCATKSEDELELGRLRVLTPDKDSGTARAAVRATAGVRTGPEARPTRTAVPRNLPTQ